MSNLSNVKPEFDFWEFISCARCHLSFNSDQGVPQIPFWLTECGHIICNNHLNADQSCAQCGDQGIQLVPLQRDMDKPMAEWFYSVPYSLDGAANAVKFQQETMASLVRYYKEKYRKCMDRIRSGLEEKRMLKIEIEDLRRQNQQLQQYVNSGEPSDALNVNGKRPMTGSHRAGTNSSPRSIVTPLGPNRLTLPPGQHAPNLSRHADESGSYSVDDTNNYEVQMKKPGSSRFVAQYAYNPPQTPQFQPPKLSHTQAASARQLQARQVQEQQRAMMPPPLPPASNRAVRAQGGNFKPVGTSNHQANAILNRSQSSSQRSDQNQPISCDQRQMGPPPTPQRHTQVQVLPPRLQTATFSQPTGPQVPARFANPQNNNRFIPQAVNTNFNQRSQRFAPPTPATGVQRFVTSAPGSRAPSHAMNGTHTSSGQGGQRMPFVPGAQGGFG